MNGVVKYPVSIDSQNRAKVSKVGKEYYPSSIRSHNTSDSENDETFRLRYIPSLAVDLTFRTETSFPDPYSI